MRFLQRMAKGNRSVSWHREVRVSRVLAKRQTPRPTRRLGVWHCQGCALESQTRDRKFITNITPGLFRPSGLHELKNLSSASLARRALVSRLLAMDPQPSVVSTCRRRETKTIHQLQLGGPLHAMFMAFRTYKVRVKLPAQVGL